MPRRGRRPGRSGARGIYPGSFVRRALIIAVGGLAFLVVSFGVARWLTRENRERAAVLALLRDQARGDGPAMLARLDGCEQDARCRARVAANARRLRRDGAVKILNYESGTRYALGSSTGDVRVAWDIGTRGDTVVQCVTVHRSGAAVLGGGVALRAISGPIGLEDSCAG